MTLNIAICDDELDDIESLKKIILQYNIKTEHNIIVSSFSSATQFMLDCSCHNYDVVLLDIEMPETSGMEVAKRLRTQNDNLLIVFITSYPEYMLDSFEVQPFQFIIKPVTYDAVNKLFNDIIKKISCSTKNIIIIDSENEKKFIPLSDVLYISSIKGQKSYVKYYLFNTELISKGTLSDIESVLINRGFISPTRGYLVNLKYVTTINSESILLKNGIQIHISRRRLKSLQQLYAKYIIDIF